MSVFNDLACLQRSLPSLAPWVDALVVADGAYAQFPYHGNQGRSDDGTWEYLQEFKRRCDKPLTLIEGRIWESQIAKRNAYLQLVPDGDWFFMLDSDEALIRVVNLLHLGIGLIPLSEPFDCGVITLIDPEDVVNYIPRLHKKYPGTRYEGNHANVVNDATGADWRFTYLPVALKHWGPLLRSPERVQQKWDYYALGNH